MIRDAASQNQVDAANPMNSTWVAANAGSGKTRVLTDRVARLLLESVDPQNILCLTYTKAAATEMQNRLFKRLGAWAMMDADALVSDLRSLGFEGRLSQEEIAKARTLFARAIETPGGLKIQTIHSFCSSILRRFPLEAGVSPQFKEMEDQTAAKLRQDVLDSMADAGSYAVTKAFFAHFSGNDLDALLSEIVSKKAFFETDFEPDALAQAFSISSSATEEDCIAAAICPGDQYLVEAIKEAFANQSKTYVTFASNLAAIDFQSPTVADFTEIKRLFLYAGKHTSKSVNFPQSNHAKAVEAAAPIIDKLHEWMDRVAEAHQKWMSVLAFERTKSLYDFSTHFVKAYEAKKQRSSNLDFDDLIGKARALLSDKDVAQWVLFRLDGGIDHVLVDEAQDTSPEQWDVIEALTREFATGEGARADLERTVFVVGDKQQSIYSFQGADPSAFDRMQTHFQTALSDVGRTLEDVKLSHSFRSSQAILRVVDDTFVGEKRDAIGKVQDHIAFNTDLPGRVDLWPVIEPVKHEAEINWTDPVDQISDEHHNAQLADRIATQIKRMLTSEYLPVQDKDTGSYDHRPVTPGDVMILVQRRSELFHEIIAACKRQRLPIAGADRLRVGAELAVKDLTAVLNFLALPEDDLSLACALRSPLFGWSEQDLYTLAYHRTKKYLWAALREDETTETFAILKDLRDQADYLRPYDIIERILTRHDGRRKLLGRLGQEAEDGIDALLSQALSYESTEVPSLTGFLTWMQTDEREIKRQMDSQGDQIRVMTVHGSKGLEAPIVILPDCAKRKNEVRAELLSADGQAIWKPKANASPQIVEDVKDALKSKQSEERLRLLYVAMTRAENWLITAAAGEVDDDTWYSIVDQGMEHSGSVDVVSGDLEIKRVDHGNWPPGALINQQKEEMKDHDFPQLEPISELKPQKVVSPSDLGGAKVLTGDPSDGDSESLERGTLIHLLLERLPDVPKADRRRIGQKILSAHHVDDAGLLDQVFDLIEDPNLAHIFAPSSLSEVNITATFPGTRESIFGAIDRLVVEDDKVTAIDFKSNRLVPMTAQEVPEGLLRQMGAYASALQQIYPERQIETAILWTETGVLMHLPNPLVSEALARVSIP